VNDSTLATHSEAKLPGGIVVAMSAIAPWRTPHFALHMSAFWGKADMAFCSANVRF